MKLALLLCAFAYLGQSWAARGSRCTEEPSTDEPPTTPSPITEGPAGSCSCGQANRVLRIVGGEETQVNEYPWHVGILVDGTYICGGSLVSDKYVVTAAHCMGYSLDLYSVQVGAHNISALDGQEIEAANIIIHRKYSSNTFKNDIAVIELAERVNFGPKVGVVCLPPPPKKMKYFNKIATISGWGSLSSGGDSPDTLMDAEVKIINNKRCEKITNDAYTLSKDMICAYGNGERDSCQGDSGGPMVVEVEGHHDLVGVTSWGFGCAQKNYPGVYSNVQKNLFWLNTKIENSGTTCS